MIMKNLIIFIHLSEYNMKTDLFADPFAWSLHVTANNNYYFSLDQ